MKFWEVIADNLSKAGWSWGCVATVDSNGQTIFIADAHRDNGKRFIVTADEKLERFSNFNESRANHIRDNGHSDRVVKKCQRIAGLKALLKEWELSGDLDLDYIRGLKARLLSVQNQLKNMCGDDGSEGMDDW